MTPAQIRTARTLLGWSRDQLAEQTMVHSRTIERMETERGIALPRNLAAVRSVLEAAGVEFTDGDAPEARLRRSAVGE